MSDIIRTKVQAMYAPGAQLGPLVELTMAQFKAQYQPGQRLSVNDPAVGEAVDKDPCLVWTELDTGERRVIVNGWCFVNREAYYICAQPFGALTDNIEVQP